MTKRETLLELETATQIMLDGTLFEVIAVGFQDVTAKKCRTDVRLLEWGKDRFSEVKGRFLAEGKTFTRDHSIFTTLQVSKSRTLEIIF